MSDKRRPPAAIHIREARSHNLKGFDLDLPLGELVVITGVSGSGKSSLAFDTLFAEGQRRYVESFSAFARQFLERMDKPQVRSIDGLPPAIAIDQTAKVRSARSTVGTMTEINDYVKLLYARVATPHCPRCAKVIARDSPQAAAQALLTRHRGARAVIAFAYEGDDAERTRKALTAAGFARVLAKEPATGLPELCELADAPGTALAPRAVVVADRLKLDEASRARLVAALEQAFKLAQGAATVYIDGAEPARFSADLSCADCGVSVRDPTPSLFSFNSPLGACPACTGFGRTITIDMDRVIPDPTLSLAKGAIKPWTTASYREGQRDVLKAARNRGIRTDVPWQELSDDERRFIHEGGDDFYGIKGFFDWLTSRVYRMHIRVLLSRYRGYVRCADCGGTRLRPEALLWRVGGLTLPELFRLPIRETAAFIHGLELPPARDEAATLILDEVKSRLGFLLDVGLDYLTLDRASRTLSGGEVERVNLTAAIGSALVNTLYVLDEPSIGLHARDNARLVATLRNLRDKGNTVIVVEHDPDILGAADRIVDMGPGPGEAGGEVIYNGSYEGLLDHQTSLTGRFLSGRETTPMREARRTGKGRLTLTGAREHNLKGIDLTVPLGTLTCVTGVSGSGKSTLVEDVLYRALARQIGHKLDEPPGAHDSLKGVEQLDDVLLVDQAAVGRTPRANPATYVKAWDGVRKLFAALDASRERGYTPRPSPSTPPVGAARPARAPASRK